jgi:hypothetical protein
MTTNTVVAGNSVPHFTSLNAYLILYTLLGVDPIKNSFT